MSASTQPSPVAANVLANFITPEDLAASLGISRRTLARWHAKRIGPARCVVGKLILYRDDTVRDWLAAMEQEQPERGRRRR